MSIIKFLYVINGLFHHFVDLQYKVIFRKVRITIMIHKTINNANIHPNSIVFYDAKLYIKGNDNNRI